MNRGIPKQRKERIIMWKYIMTLLVSMVPIVELRGAIPIGVTAGVPWQAAVAISMVGNMIPVPFIFFFSYSKRYKKSKVDTLIPVGAVAVIGLVVIEAGRKLLMLMPEKIAKLMGL